MLLNAVAAPAVAFGLLWGMDGWITFISFYLNLTPR